MNKALWALVFLGFGLTGCSTSGQRTSVVVSYYDVKGTSFTELNREIALHGPVVPGVGKAIASTNIKMFPDVHYGIIDGKCTVTKSKIKVRASVTLPNLKDRKLANKNLQSAFSNIESFAKNHEAVHVAIADQFAAKAEKQILALKPVSDCNQLKTTIGDVFNSVLDAHEKAQLKFDADEKKRILAARSRTS